jgi:hypothetical protein
MAIEKISYRESSGRTMKRMSRGLIVLCLLLCGVVSCTEEKKTVKKYGNTLTQSYKTVKKIDKDLNVQQVQKSIQEFSAANGRYPAYLGELSSFNGMALDSTKYTYDPTTGTLTEK